MEIIQVIRKKEMYGGIESYSKLIASTFKNSQFAYPQDFNSKCQFNLAGEKLFFSFDFFREKLKREKHKKLIVVHDPSWLGILGRIFSRVYKVQIIFVNHSFPPTIKGLFFRVMRQIFSNRYCLEVYTSSYMKKNNLCRNAMEIVIPPAVLLPNKALIRKSSETCQNLQLIFIGRLVRYKGLSEFLSELSAATHPNFVELTIIGEGPEKENIIKKAKSHGINLKFLGQINDSEKFKLISKSDALVLPSLGASEAFGLVQLEALSVGTMVISRTGNPYTDALHRELEGVVTYHDVTSLSAALVSCLTMKKVLIPSKYSVDSFQYKWQRLVYYDRLK